MQLLLMLKRHLKIVYGLDDARCQVMNGLPQTDLDVNGSSKIGVLFFG